MSPRPPARRRTLLAAATMTAAFALAIPATATAAPSTGSSTTGSAAVVDLGKTVIGTGSSMLGGDTRILDGVVELLDTGSAALGTGSAAVGSLDGGPADTQPTVTQQCNASTKSGGAGVTTTRHELGRTGPTSFKLSYETYNIPDTIEVFYEGKSIYNTGPVGDNINEGTGSAVINVPAGRDTAVTVKVTGPNGTDWDYTVNCPS